MDHSTIRIRLPRWAILAGALLTPAATATATAGAEGPPGARAFLDRHCVACHGGEDREAGVDLASLAWRPDDPGAFALWVRVFDAVDAHAMPPTTEKWPRKAERAGFLDALRGALTAANLAAQRAEGRVVLRRLNRVEYERTLHDLLAIDLPLAPYLPEDAPAHGFDNVAEGLRLSASHMERYLEAADAALGAAIDLRRRPAGLSRRFRYHDEESVRDDAGKPGKKSFRVLPDAVVIFDDNSPTVLHKFRPGARGRYRIKVSASAFQCGDRPAWLKLYATDFKTRRLLGYFDLPEGGREVEVVAVIEAGERLDPSPADTNYDARGRGNYDIGAGAFTGRGVAIRWVEIEGPLLDSWPPPGVARLFGATRVEPIPKPLQDRDAPAFVLAPEDPKAAMGPLLRDFAARAFRRPVADDEVAPYVDLAARGRDEGLSFEGAMRVAFRAVLMSPRFLFLDERPGRLDDWALAARLSYFLWSTAPDDALRRLADEGRLHDPEALRGQVDRMLDSPRSRAFVANFLGQWLDLRRIDATQPDRKLYPEFDDILRASMVGESEAFFAELLRSDGGLDAVIDSDFLMLNRRLAEHYGIGGVVGEEFRRVANPPGSRRGGVLTQASVLKVTANGTTTSPVIRGAWVLRHLLGDPPAPPPDVPSFEPDTRGATTIRDQLARHRASAACASCHDRIDPPGFALEGFDVIGGRRDRYRAERGNSTRREDLPRGKFRGREVWEYRLGPAVDASGRLPDGSAFEDVDGFRRRLLGHRDRVARNLARNLLVYATGAGIQFADRAAVDEILARAEADGGGLRSLVHEVVQSPAFRCK